MLKNNVKFYIYSKNIAAKAAKSTEIAPDETVADDEQRSASDPKPASFRSLSRSFVEESPSETERKIIFETKQQNNGIF